MGWIGLALLLATLALMLCSGWPTYAVLLGVCAVGAALGLALGAFNAALLGSLPARVLGLLEHDLLQALALYALVGALLNHLALGGTLYAGLQRLLARVAPRAAPEAAGLLLGTLLAPMNGSVGASLLALARSADAQWSAQGLAPARRGAAIALAGTLGVVVPPSLVLLLLGDAMMRAHTEGLNIARELALPLAGAGIRIVNTQDVLQAALVPGALLLAGWLAITLWRARRLPPVAAAPDAAGAWHAGQAWTLLLVPLLIGTLLVLVALGRVRAVEAAATAALLLLGWGVLTGQLGWARLWRVLDDAMALTGALFALLLAATSLTLLLRAYGSDRLVGDAMLALQGHPAWALACGLALVLGCAFVLDAFELIFLVVPVLMPPLLAQVGDAAWVAVLVLLVLQAGFLLPPFGYAVVLARAQVHPRPALRAMAAALAPYLAWCAVTLAAVALWPQCTRWLRSAPATVPAAVNDEQAVERLMREMSQPRR
jgi:TRAP-type mannitol/chloroaromatic compound transport system permease large subunit